MNSSNTPAEPATRTTAPATTWPTGLTDIDESRSSAGFTPKPCTCPKTTGPVLARALEVLPADVGGVPVGHWP